MVNWSDRVAPGVEVMRFRARHKLAVITQERELEAAADTIEEMARRLDAYQARAGWALYLFVLIALTAIFGGR